MSIYDEQLTIFRRRNIGFIFQNYNLVPILNVYENIVLPVELDGDTAAQLKKERMKKIFTMTAITLAAFLMSSVLLLISGIMKVNRSGGSSITGAYHALISGVAEEQYQKLSDDVRVELSGLTASIGSLKSGSSRLNISYSDKDALALNGLSVSEGKMPEKDNEILIEKEYLISQKINAGIGDTILLPDSDKEGKNSFIITGYLKTGVKGTDRSLYAVIVSEEYLLERDGWNIFPPAVMLRVNSDTKTKSDDIRNLISQIAADAGCEQTPSYNEAYLKLSQPSVWMILAARSWFICNTKDF